MAASLTPKQARFVDEYLVDANGTRAAMAAGYSRVSARVTAHRLLTKAAVRAAIAARQARDSQRLEIERQDVIKGLLEAVAQAREQGDPAAMITGWSAIARMLGFNAPQKVQVAVDSDIASEMERLDAMSDAELIALADQHSAG